MAAAGGGVYLTDLALATTPVDTSPENGQTKGEAKGDYMAPWIETDECTSCDECIKINKNIFAYNTDKKVFIQNPDGGSYQDLVKAAEKCTASVIHPGLPKDRSEKDVDKWVSRGEKFN